MRKAWAGHITRMLDSRISKQLGGQRKRFKDSLKTSLTDFSISTESWETLATDRPTWCSHLQQGAKRTKEERTKTAEKRELRKARAASVTDTMRLNFFMLFPASRYPMISERRVITSGRFAYVLGGLEVTWA
ncbi:hypothetical protein Pmani_013336 [Petrolisthes manimaculis]|uniref:Uncharacterized protein n=1 Tax=Petrolisthes manimaculis TaxID=1843537 RepID=A0AAE1PXQ6_9EUCA|nr:hypothetical protein Pmani_013336 [Petrolisthes manimaculis]